MVSLDVGHPEIIEFIDSKHSEELKVAALIAQGYDPTSTGEAYRSSLRPKRKPQGPRD